MAEHQIELNERESSYKVKFWEAVCSCKAFQFSSSLKGEAARHGKEHVEQKRGQNA